MYYTIDRIEDKFAVLINDAEKIEKIQLTDLPVNIHEGDILLFDGEKYSVDLNKTMEKKRLLKERLSKIFNKKKDDGGNDEN